MEFKIPLSSAAFSVIFGDVMNLMLGMCFGATGEKRSLALKLHVCYSRGMV